MTSTIDGAGAGVAPWTASLDHVGHVVPDLEAAMAGLSTQFGLRWEPVQHYELAVRDRDAEVVVPLTVVISLDPPVRVELFQEAAGGPWTRRRGEPIHHLSYWVEDFVAEAARLQALGWRLEVTGTGPEEINAFCYLVGPDGLRVEPKSLDGTPGARAWRADGA